MREERFLKGAVTLGAAAVAVKLMGALFRIPLTNLLGGVGMSCFAVAYDLFTPVYSVTVTGLSVAVSRKVSELEAEGGGGETVFRCARRLFLLFGAAGTVALLWAAPAVASWIGSPGAVYAMLTIAPAVFFTCLSAAYRGYFQGLGNMTPTAVSQVAEGASRLIFGIGLCWMTSRFFMNPQRPILQGLEDSQAAVLRVRLAAAGAAAGVTVSTAAGAWVVSRWKRCPGRPIKRNHPGLARELLRIAAPISASALVLNLSALIDLGTVINGLRKIPPASLMAFYRGMVPPQVTDALLPEYLYGCYSGLALSVFHLVPAMTAPIGVSAVPEIAAAWTSGSRALRRERVSYVLGTALMIALPAGAGICVLAEPILHFLYPSRAMEAAAAAKVLAPLGAGAALAAVSAPVNSMLQAAGREKLPLLFLMLGAAAKLACGIVLTAVPEINLLAVAWGTAACYGLICIPGLAALWKITGGLEGGIRMFLAPMAEAVLCGWAAKASYSALGGIPGPARLVISVIFSAGISIIPVVLGLNPGISLKKLGKHLKNSG